MDEYQKAIKWWQDIINKYPPFDPVDWIPKRILEDRAKGIKDNYLTLREYNEHSNIIRQDDSTCRFCTSGTD